MWWRRYRKRRAAGDDDRAGSRRATPSRKGEATISCAGDTSLLTICAGAHVQLQIWFKREAFPRVKSPTGTNGLQMVIKDLFRSNKSPTDSMSYDNSNESLGGFEGYDKLVVDLIKSKNLTIFVDQAQSELIDIEYFKNYWEPMNISGKTNFCCTSATISGNFDGDAGAGYLYVDPIFKSIPIHILFTVDLKKEFFDKIWSLFIDDAMWRIKLQLTLQGDFIFDERNLPCPLTVQRIHVQRYINKNSI